MVVGIIIVIISFFFDGILSNYLPFLVNNLSLFTPLFTITSLIIIYRFFLKNNKEYLLLCFLTGFFYDLLYTNLLFFNAIMFLILGLIIRLIYKGFNFNYYTIIADIVLIIAVYESLTALIFVLYNLVPITIPKLIYKIDHSLILNIIYGELLLLITNILPKKYKKIKIN